MLGIVHLTLSKHWAPLLRAEPCLHSFSTFDMSRTRTRQKLWKECCKISKIAKFQNYMPWASKGVAPQSCENLQTLVEFCTKLYSRVLFSSLPFKCIQKFPGFDRGAISLLVSTFTFTFKLGNCVLCRGVDGFSRTKYLVQVKSWSKPFRVLLVSGKWCLPFGWSKELLLRN